MAVMLPKSFRCGECGGRVVSARPRPDKTWTLRPGVEVPLPDDLPIPTCDRCGEYYINTKLSAAIEERLGASEFGR